MKREILFRGMRMDGKGWVYGHYVIDPKGCHRIYWKPFEEATSNTYHFVKPETVGQFSGLVDRNGVKIFEGDKVSGGDYTAEVFWDAIMSAWGIRGGKFDGGHWSGTDLLARTVANDTVIGNIHEQ